MIASAGVVIAKVGVAVLLLVFFWGLWIVREADKRHRDPENPRHEPPQPRCPECGRPYVSWSYAPPVIGLHGETIVKAVHSLRCAQGHRWFP